MRLLAYSLLFLPALLFSQTFPTDWGRKHEIIIQNSQVDATLSNFPVLFTEDNFDTEFLDADGTNAPKSDGGDVYFSSDAAGSSRLSVDIELFSLDNNPSLSKIVIWVKVPSVSSTVNTSVWVWYKQASASQPARSATYGAEDVWSNSFISVQHLNETYSTASDNYKDMTSNLNHGTLIDANTNSAQIDGKIGKAVDFNGDADYINLGQDASIKVVNNHSFSAWVKTGYSERQGIIARITETSLQIEFDDVMRGWATDSLGNTGESFKCTANITDNTWHYLVMTYDKSTWRAYLDGASECTGTAVTGKLRSLGNDTHIGDYTGSYMDGIIDEARISNITRSSGWISTEYNNQNAPSTFAIKQTPQDANPAETTRRRVIIVN